MNYRRVQLLLTCALVVLMFCIMYYAVPFGCRDCEQRHVNQDFLEIYNKARTGDLLLVNSNDFFSKMIRDIDDCEFAGVKLVYEIEPGEKAIIVSDAANLADTKRGLIVKNMLDYFDDYNHARVALFRLKEGVKRSEYKNINMLAQRAGEGNITPISYDFSFYNENRDKMTCAKILLSVFGENNLLNRKRENHPIFQTTLACDVDMQKIKQVTPWINYWKK